MQGCCEARSETNLVGVLTRDSYPVVDSSNQVLRRRELTRCSERKQQNINPEIYVKSVSFGIYTFDDENSKDNYITPIFLANINDPDIADKVKKIKAQCEVERRKAESQRLAGAETTNMLKQMMGIHHLGEQQR